jgi:hypothetical protein
MTLRAFLACSLLALPAAAWCQTATRPTAADFREGEQWTWRQVNELTKLEMTKSGRQSVMKDGRLLFLGSSGRYFTIGQVYDVASRPWPLEIGMTWKHENAWQESSNEPGKTWQNAKVVAYEAVTVPAGTFMAFRIEYKGSYSMTDARHMQWTGEVNDTYWYAPEVKADVMHSRESHGRNGGDRWRNELTSYGPGPN